MIFIIGCSTITIPITYLNADTFYGKWSGFVFSTEAPSNATPDSITIWVDSDSICTRFLNRIWAAHTFQISGSNLSWTIGDKGNAGGILRIVFSGKRSFNRIDGAEIISSRTVMGIQNTAKSFYVIGQCASDATGRHD